ncbi:transposable element [Tanacetum coccineum]
MFPILGGENKKLDKKDVSWNASKIYFLDLRSGQSSEIINDEIIVPKSIGECRQRNDWQKWQDAIQAELDSLEKRQVFGPVTLTPNKVKPVGYKWVFAIKRNEKNEIVRYKARLVAQGFSQIPGVDYEETYSPVVDATTLRFLISLANVERLQMRLMDVVTAYLYGSLDSDIYMKIPEGMKMPEACKSKPREMFSIKLKRSLYGLKQSGRMWYNRLSEYLSKEGYKNVKKRVVDPASEHLDFMLSGATTLAKHVVEVRHVIWMNEIQDVVWRVGEILISKIWCCCSNPGGGCGNLSGGRETRGGEDRFEGSG